LSANFLGNIFQQIEWENLVSHVPELPTVDEAADWAAGRSGLTTAVIQKLVVGVMGQSDKAPAELLLRLADSLPRGQRGGLLGPIVMLVWVCTEFPHSALTRDEWRRLFADASYRVDNRLAERPARALKLYRGATFDGRRGWSWTDTPEVALLFASGERGRPIGCVWEAIIESARLLAHNTERGEYVVDMRGSAEPRMLSVKEYEGLART